MTELFYRWQRGDAEPAFGPPAGIEFRWWRPAYDGLSGAAGPYDTVWWAFGRLGVFSRDDFGKLTAWRDGAMVHRLIVTPRWYRFPDMTRDDLQLGNLWTSSNARGQGLARAAIAEAHRRYAGRFERMWYIADQENLASTRTIEACGYRLVGIGARTRPLGLAPLGRFRMTRRAGSAALEGDGGDGA